MKRLKKYKVNELSYSEVKKINGGDKFSNRLGYRIGQFFSKIFDGNYCDSYGARVYND